MTAPGCLTLGGSLSRGSLAANRGSIMSTVSSLVGPPPNKQSSSTLASLAGLLSETTSNNLMRSDVRDRDGVSEGSSSSKDREWGNRESSFNSGRDAVSIHSGRDALSILSSREASIYGPRDTASIQSIRDGSMHSSRDPSIHSTRDGSILSSREAPVHMSRDGSLLSAREASIHSGRDLSIHSVREGSIHSDRDSSIHTSRDISLQNTLTTSVHSSHEPSVYTPREDSLQSTRDSVLSGHDASLHSSRDSIPQHGFRDGSVTGGRELNSLNVREGSTGGTGDRRSRTFVPGSSRSSSSASCVTFPSREVVPVGPLDPGWDENASQDVTGASHSYSHHHKHSEINLPKQISPHISIHHKDDYLKQARSHIQRVRVRYHLFGKFSFLLI